jgi:hypothetical protein
MWELGVEIRVRQSPDWRLASRHSGEWRSRDRRPAELNLNFQLEPLPAAFSQALGSDFPISGWGKDGTKSNFGIRVEAVRGRERTSAGRKRPNKK